MLIFRAAVHKGKHLTAIHLEGDVSGRMHFMLDTYNCLHDSCYKVSPVYQEVQSGYQMESSETGVCPDGPGDFT